MRLRINDIIFFAILLTMLNVSCYTKYVNNDETIMLHSNGNWDFKRDGKRLSSGKYNFISEDEIYVESSYNNLNNLPVRHHEIVYKFIDSIDSNVFVIKVYENTNEPLRFFGLEILDNYDEKVFDGHGGVEGKISVDSKYKELSFLISFSQLPTIFINELPNDINYIELTYHTCNYDFLSGLDDVDLFKTKILVNKKYHEFKYAECD